MLSIEYIFEYITKRVKFTTLFKKSISPIARSTQKKRYFFRSRLPPTIPSNGSSSSILL